MFTIKIRGLNMDITGTGAGVVGGSLIAGISEKSDASGVSLFAEEMSKKYAGFAAKTAEESEAEKIAAFMRIRRSIWE